MEGIGAEVWQKIRSAIKAKLMELGAYIDEELPEYIMVMVGNKRSQSQMEEDLKLFLGSNSVHFTTWLHQVLQKLQEVTVPNLEIKKMSGTTSSKRKSTDEPVKKKKKVKSSTDVSDKKSDKKVKDVTIIVENKSKDIVSTTDDNVTSTLINDNSSDQENIESLAVKSLPEQEIQVKIEESKVVRSENIDKVLEEEVDDVDIEINVNKVKKEKSPSIYDGEDEDFLNIKADMEGEDLMEGDTELYEEPLQKEMPKTPVPRKRDSTDSESEKSVPKRHPSSPTNSAKRHTDKKFDCRHLLNRKTDARELLNRKAAARLAVNDDKHSVGKTSKREKDHSPPRRHYDNDKSYNDRHSSRRVIVTTLDTSNSKSRKYDDEKDKSSADRSHNSSVGVKRKSNSEVNDNNTGRDKVGDRQKKKGHESSSVETIKKSKLISISQTLKEEVQPRVRSSESEDNRKRSGVLSRVVPRRHEPEDSVETPIPSVIKVTPRPRRPLSQQASHTLILRAMADANKSMASVLPRTDVQQKKCPRLEAGMFTRTLREKNRIPPDKIAVSITNNRVSPPDKHSNSSKKDMEIEEKQQEILNNKPVPRSSESVSENGSIASKVNSSISEPGAEESEGAESTDHMVGEWLKGVNEARLKKNILDQSKGVTSEENNVSFSTKREDGPQFVVTLNGLDPALFFKDVDDDLEYWDKPKEIEFPSAENFGNGATEMQSLKRKRPTSPIVIVKKTANNNNLVDVMEATKNKPVERCKYWPNCRTGDQCVYHHPVTPCKAFPTCKFGEHCLFIHPQCKFNAACTRRGCPYSHTSTILQVPPTVTKTIQACRFFPKCTNLTCPFFHPKICKFGSYCTKKDCTFSHNEIATVDKLKWSREGTT